MDEFQIYTIASEVFGDLTPDKRRPSVYIGISSEKFGHVRFLGVYTHKDKFARKNFTEKMYKIQDKEIAHLNSDTDSYIDVSSEILLSLAKVRELANPIHIEQLSEKDIIGLIAKYNGYNPK